jgi:hypothetical protein
MDIETARNGRDRRRKYHIHEHHQHHLEVPQEGCLQLRHEYASSIPTPVLVSKPGASNRTERETDLVKDHFIK